MTIKNLKNYPVIKKAYQLSLKTSENIYLVGGAVRDVMMGFFNERDYDFIVEKDFEAFVGLFAKAVRGTVIPWDFNQTRVVFRENDQWISADFSKLKGTDLCEDLKQRDFTINAITVDLKSLMEDAVPEIIDPLGGCRDLKKKSVKICSDDSFIHDPLRILRGIRFARKFEFSIDRRTYVLMSEKAPLILNVSKERILRELFSIFHLPNSDRSVSELMETGVLPVLIPELLTFSTVEQVPPHRFDLLKHSLKTVSNLNFITLDCGEILNTYKDKLNQYFNEHIEGYVSRKSLLIMTGLLHDIGKTKTAEKRNGKITFYGHDGKGAQLNREIGLRLGLSKRSQRVLHQVTKNHMRLLQLSQLQTVSERALQRFIKDTEGTTLETVFLALADVRATSSAGSYKKTISGVEKTAFDIVQKTFSALEHSETELFITGDEVIKILDISEGPEVGNVLQEIREGERNGIITSREEALKWLKRKKKLLSKS